MIGKKIHNLLSDETEISWVRTWNNSAILAPEMKFHLSKTQQSSLHKALAGLDRTDFHPLSVR